MGEDDVAPDPSDHAAVERALLEANEALKQADEVKTTFLRTVSHDVRSPLTAILSAARLLDGDIPLSDEERKSFVQMIIRNSNRIRDLLDDVLDVERLRAGDPIEPEPEAVDVAALVAEIEPELLNATGKTITVHADVPTVWADHTMLERIMHNLLGNAVKYTPKDGEITVRTWQDGGTTILAVDDRGTGVPDDAKEIIFEPFRRSADLNIPGSGIGLSLVSSFARAHGGRAWVEDNPGGGSSFRVCFPTASAS